MATLSYVVTTDDPVTIALAVLNVVQVIALAYIAAKWRNGRQQ